MAKYIYFYDKVTQHIIGMNSHAEKDPKSSGGMKEADADITSVWEDIRTGRMWPFLLEKITDKNPDNFGFIQADETPKAYNEYEPHHLSGSLYLKRRPYLCLKMKPSPKIMKEIEHDDSCFYEVNTDGGVILDMEVCVKHTHQHVEKHAEDKNIKGINGSLLAEVTLGRMNPRDGNIEMKNSKAQFQWILPDITSKEPARCYVKDPQGKILISKSLRVKCC
ncbi:MAG: hypothetical protein A3I05_08690 [Deltaproteobacteria bacterium RIFCSPLOWO2_02_FULL_44_10]|nr:MAG: hypothetical protein A3C46_02225 [Deltaproteobacteria bacterium RIFCSPHIGHO2_02_FULL_44_16]OGQ45773.1 MAG: hypothetical protein A3I05_08690 [Deltaproteobacteria bacterium RIFCSPLOWO2_02_FULL_44_10]